MVLRFLALCLVASPSYAISLSGDAQAVACAEALFSREDVWVRAFGLESKRPGVNQGDFAAFLERTRVKDPESVAQKLFKGFKPKAPKIREGVVFFYEDLTSLLERARVMDVRSFGQKLAKVRDTPLKAENQEFLFCVLQGRCRLNYNTAECFNLRRVTEKEYLENLAGPRSFVVLNPYPQQGSANARYRWEERFNDMLSFISVQQLMDNWIEANLYLTRMGEAGDPLFERYVDRTGNRIAISASFENFARLLLICYWKIGFARETSYSHFLKAQDICEHVKIYDVVQSLLQHYNLSPADVFLLAEKVEREMNATIERRTR